METDKIIIRIFDEEGGNVAVSVGEGDAIHQKIDIAIADEFIVVLDFQNIDIITTAFLNACIGQLHSKHLHGALNQYLKFENVKNEDKHLFSKAIKRAKEYFANPDDFHQLVKKVMGHEQHS